MNDDVLSRGLVAQSDSGGNSDGSSSSKAPRLGLGGFRRVREPSKLTLSIVCISDTHGSYDKVAIPAPPSAESVLVHCGDFDCGSRLEEWLNSPPMSAYKYKLVVCGNDGSTHSKPDSEVMLPPWYPDESDYETCLQRSIEMQTAAGVMAKSTIRSAVLLLNSGVTIGGHVFWGSPYHLRDPNDDSANTDHFRRTEEELHEVVGLIPNDTAVLLTHCGPKGSLDKSTVNLSPGSQVLLERVSDTGCMHALKLHVFLHLTSIIDAAIVDGATAAQSLPEPYGSIGHPLVAGDVRVIKRSSGPLPPGFTPPAGTLFANMTAPCIASGHVHMQQGKDLEAFAQDTLRAPLVFRLPPGDNEEAELLG